MNSIRFERGFTHDVVKNHYPLHSHQAVEIVWHVGGRGVDILSNGDEAPFGVNAVVIHGHARPHGQTNTISGMDRCIQLLVEGDLNNKIGEYQIISNISGLAVQEEMKYLSANQQVPEGLMDIYHARAQAVLLTLLHAVRHADKRSEKTLIDKIHDAEMYIRRHFQDVISNKDIATHLGLSEDYFRHQFKIIHGLSPMDFVQQCRLEHAKQLLEHTSLKQQAIAEQCGFQNIRYFNTRFSHYLGISPGSYRKQFR